MRLFSDAEHIRSEIRKIEDLSDPGFFLWVFGMGVVSAAGYLFADLTVLAPWYVSVLAVIGISQLVNWRLQNDTSDIGLLLSLFCGVAQSAVVAYLPWWLWCSENLANQYFAALIAIGALIHLFVICSNCVPMLVATVAPFYIGVGLAAPISLDGSFAQTMLAFLGSMLILSLSVVSIQNQLNARKKREEADRKSMEAERVAAMARFSSEIAHDFNNVLAVIKGNLELRRELNESTEENELLAEAYDAADRGAVLVRQLSRYVREEDHQAEVVCINHTLERVVATMRRLAPSQVTVCLETAPRDVFMEVDEVQLEAALMNLFTNSCHACDDNGEITFRLLDSFDAGQDATSTFAIEVSDDGVGIAPGDIKRVVSPYFTTKGAWHGTGLGLSSVTRFVDRFDGTFAIESKPGMGTTVRMVFTQTTRPAGR